MTKLLQLLTLLAVFTAIWWSLITDRVPIDLSPAVKEVIYASPIYLLLAFACYSLAVVGYRVATFNDCVEASEELKEEVKAARKDLASKGFKFS